MKFRAGLWRHAPPAAARGYGRSRILATDLAQKLLAKNKVPRVTKIGVVDSGYESSLKNEINTENFAVKPGLPSVSALDKDLVGHGTRVVSLIKGKEGIGASAESPLTVYALGKGSAEVRAELGEAILRACEDGNQIVNASIGLDIAMFQLSIGDLISKNIERKLRANGCIVVHAAGNGAGTYSDQTDALEPQVAAVTSHGSKATFSSSGEIRTPGQNVIGINVGTESGADRADECNGSHKTFASGTSFAAPLYSAHLALVRDALIQSPKFVALSKLAQASLLSEISEMSNVNGTVNSYLAVQIGLSLG